MQIQRTGKAVKRPPTPKKKTKNKQKRNPQQSVKKIAIIGTLSEAWNDNALYISLDFFSVSIVNYCILRISDRHCQSIILRH